MPTQRLNFDALISPVRAEDFFSDYWERAPLHVRRSLPGAYAPLLDLADLDYLTSVALRMPERLVESLGDPAAGPYAVRPVAAPSELYDACARGASFRLRGLHRYWKPLRDLARSLEQKFACTVGVNLYSSPASAQGLDRHYDNHDVLVLQIAGRKSWRLHAPLVRLPLKHAPPASFERRVEELDYFRGGPLRSRGRLTDEETGAPTHELTLEQGDLLYLPRGFVHEARAEDEASVHLTVGLHVTTWLDLMAVALGQLAQRDERFRRSLPVGVLHDAGAASRADFDALVEAFASGASLRDALTEVAEGFVRTREDAGDGALLGGAGDASKVGAETLLERRPGLVCRFVAEGDSVGLASARGALWMPKPFEAALAFAARAEEFRPRDIPGRLSEAGRLALARRLIQDGFVRVAAAREESREE